MKKFCFSGKLGVGKDHIANQCGLARIGFADPMYRIAQHYFGTFDKTQPGMRAFLQTIGAWGRNMVSSEYPLTVERALFGDALRANGKEITGFPGWADFDRSPSFWIDILLARVKAMDNFAITNCRFKNEIETLTAAGVSHFHITCSRVTWLDRLTTTYGFNDNHPTLQDVTENMARELDEKMPDNRVIWNDTRPMPEGKKYIWADEFAAMVKALK